jgi:tetratricopeptide (TPR) repeat protein
MEKRLNNRQYLGKNLAKYLNRAIALLGFTAVLFTPIELSQARAFAEVVGQEVLIADTIIEYNYREGNVDRYFQLADSCFDRGDYEGAIANYTQSLRINPNFAPTYNNRGNSYSALGEYQKALADYTQALRLDPNYAGTYNNRGGVYNELGEYQKALADHNQALRLDPNQAAAYINRAVVYVKQGDYQRALVDYSQVLRLDPNDAGAYLGRGILFFLIGDSQKAMSDLQRAASLSQQQGDMKTYQKALELLDLIRQ